MTMKDVAQLPTGAMILLGDFFYTVHRYPMETVLVYHRGRLTDTWRLAKNGRIKSKKRVLKLERR